ncbi:aminotransferase class V-fold PLP-dependent enzyme [Bacteroidota bacterium]
MVNKKYPIDKYLFFLDDKLKYLNHASFGATPKLVMERFLKLTQQVENNPMQFYLVDYPLLMAKSRIKIAEFLNSQKDNIAFVDNATTGVNTVLHSLQHQINSKWEILTVNHYYPAIKNTLKYLSNVTGCKIIAAELPDYTESKEQIIDIIKTAVSEKTKLMVIDHISSISAIIFPLKEIIDFCRNNNILILIDGAHAPGFLDLNLDELKPDWYTGNLHKWLFAPKGTAIFYASKPDKHDIHPVVISNNYQNGFTKEFDWTGTKNFCSWLTVPECIEFHQQYFDWDYCRQLSIYARNLIISKLGLKPLANESLTGLMHSFWLPESSGSTMEDVINLRKTLLEKYQIEIFMYPFNGRIVLRTSSQVYNHEEEYNILVKALKDIL